MIFTTQQHKIDWNENSSEDFENLKCTVKMQSWVFWDTKFNKSFKAIWKWEVTILTFLADNSTLSNIPQFHFSLNQFEFL